MPSTYTLIYTLATTALVLALLVRRITNVRRVRFDRVNALLAENARLVEDPTRMTYQEAQEILKVAQCYDVPWVTSLSLSFALFKTYAVPSISFVLCKSNQLASPKLASRRAEDTAVFINEFVSGGLDSVRGTTALARMNWLHARYGALIGRDDMLFTLSLFIFEPMGWIERFEWRALTEIEKEARYVFWREVGARMGIASIPSTRQALWEWKEAYAQKAFKYHPNNTRVGDATFDVFLKPAPAFLKPFGKTASLIFLDDLTREAFGYPRSPAYLHVLVPALVKLKGLVSGYLLYPRTTQPHHLQVEEIPDNQGGHFLRRKGFLFEPWYVDPAASPVGELGYGKPGGKQWQDHGFKSEHLGPERLRHQGADKVLASAQEMRDKIALCPFFQP